MKNKLIKWAKIILTIYFLVGAALYFLQEKLMFQPKSLNPGFKYGFISNYEEVNIQYDTETTFNVIQFKTIADSSLPKEIGHQKGTCKGVVLYFHGNRENIGRYAHFASNFTKNNYEVWMIDYPTFGKSTGKLNEGMFYEEALQFYRLANAKFHADSIIIYGKSLGTGIASQLAGIKKCKRLILETPYYSMLSLIKRYAWIYPIDYFSKYKIPTNEYLKKVSAPITIFHGTDDGVIPYSNASKLKMAMKPSDEFITIENGSHNDLDDFNLFHQKLDSLLF